MSNFYASISGTARTKTTRRGTESSGISGHIRGWNVGVHIEGSVESDGTDSFLVYATYGSNGKGKKVLAVIIRQGPNGPEVGINDKLLKALRSKQGMIKNA